MLGSLILYIKGMRILMFQLSGFYCTCRAETKTNQVILPGVFPDSSTSAASSPNYALKKNPNPKPLNPKP